MKDKVVTVDSSEQFSKLLSEDSSKNYILLVHFWASWSESCVHLNSIINELSTKADCNKVIFLLVDAEKNEDLSKRYKISAVPTFIFIRNSTEFDRIDGAIPAELTRKTLLYASGVCVPQVKSLSTDNAQVNGICSDVKNMSNQEFENYLKQLVNKHKCMIFIKGTPDEPKCGFTRQLITLLEEQKVDYQSFDILQDERVREGLKNCFNWPTYPQLYIDGELIGGLDIVKELLLTNELQSKLPRKQLLNDRLKVLINKAPVMIFIKGTPTEPRCGFSKTLVAIFNEMGLKFDYFDILKDEEVRQGLKTYSNWPTYPQVYVKGELIGGVDIIKEMKETGELQSIV